MSTAQDELREMLAGSRDNGKADESSALCAWLTDALGLDVAGLKVTGAEVFGRGPKASVDVHLSDGARLTFDRFSDIPKPTMLVAYLVTQTGVPVAVNGAEAGQIAAAIFQLAQHHTEASEDEAAREWGCEYLRIAAQLAVDLSDQADRWRAFATLARDNPARDAGEDRSAYTFAQMSTVLVDCGGGSRLVRTSWFQHYVKREVGGLYSPAALAVQMQRVGWQRPNSEGRVKATCPTDGKCLGWSFYRIPQEWPEDDQPWVPAGSDSNARAHMRARKTFTPAGTQGWSSSGHSCGIR